MGKQIAAGVFGIAAISVAAFVFADHFDATDKYSRTANLIAISAAVIGSVLSMVRIEFGPPLAIGGLALFIGNAVTLIVTRIDLSTAFHDRDSRLILIAGAIGVVAVVLFLTLMDGNAFIPIIALVAVLALAAVACAGALAHVDKVHGAVTIAPLAGDLIVALLIIGGGVKGRLGVFTVIIAGGAQIPGWLQIALHHHDRRPFAIGGFVVTCALVLLGIVAFVISLTGGGAPEGPEHAVVSPVVTPMVAPTSVIPAEPKVGPVLVPVAPPVIHNVQPPMSTAGVNGDASIPAQWSPDPYGRYEVRYWNGTRWTDHVSTRGVTAHDPI